MDPLPRVKMNTQSGIQRPEDAGKRRSTREDEEVQKGDGGTCTGEPLEDGRDLGAGRERQRGGK